MTDYLVANAKELQTALSKASGGDVISLKSGDYGQFDLNGLNFSSQVTIRSADGKQGATFDKITVENCSNLRIDSVHVDYPSNSGQSAVHILDSSRISFVNSEVNGKVDGDYTGPFAGIYVTGDTSGLVIANNDLHHVHRGMVFYGGRDLTVSGNTVDYVSEDAFNFGNIKGGLIENNVGPTHFFPASGAHSDFMQFAGSGSDLVIRGNMMLLENRFSMQGIFLNNGTFNDVLIEQNLIYTGMMNGIYVSSGDGVIVKNNTLINAPGYVSDATLIRLQEGGVVQDNIFTNKTGGTKGSDTVVQYLDPKGDNYIGGLFSNGTTISPEKLANVLDNFGTEGAYKLLEALSSGSYSSLAEYPAPTVDSNSNSESGSVLTLMTSVAPPEGATIGLGTTEAESLDLSGAYAVEALSGGLTVIKSSGTGTASGSFTGASGTYWLDVDWLNENDGAANFKVMVNGTVVESWTGTGGNGSLETTRVGLDLQVGDTITLQGTKNVGEFARIDKIALSEQGGNNTPQIDGANSNSESGSVLTLMTSVAPPEGATIGLGTTEAESLDLSGAYAVEALSGGLTVIKSSGTGTASGSFTGASGTYWLDVDWLNENDGAANFKVMVNGTVVESWTGTGGNGSLETTRVGLDLQVGDTITLQGTKNVGEFARIDKIALSEQGGNNTPQIDGANSNSVSTSTNISSNSNGSAIYTIGGDTEFSGRHGDVFRDSDNGDLQLSEGTLAFSFEADTTSGQYGLVSVTGSGSNFKSWVKDGTLYVRFEDNNETDEFVVNGIKANTKYDVQATLNGDQVALYVDDNLVGKKAFDGDWSESAPDLTAGGYDFTNKFAFDGTISDLAVYDEAYTPQDLNYFS